MTLNLERIRSSRFSDIALAVLLLAASVVPPVVHAFEIYPSAVTASGSLVCGEPDYDLTYTVGEVAVGRSSNTEFRLWSGFQPPRRVTVLCPTVAGIHDLGPVDNLSWSISVNPNPSSGALQIRYNSRSTAPPRVVVHDLSGREVKVLQPVETGVGPHHVYWDGLDASGNEVVSGLYFVVLHAEGRRQTERLVVLR